MPFSSLHPATTLEGVLTQFPPWTFVLLFVMLFSQAIYLFMDGRRRGIRGYWIWALWGLTTVPMPILLYGLTRLVINKRRKQPPG